MKQTQSASNNIVQRLGAQLKQMLWRVDAAEQWFRGENNTAVAAPTGRVPLLVLARDLYSETWEQFNIRSQRAVRNILSLRDDAASTMYFIGSLHDGQRQVLRIRLTEQGQQLRSKGWVVLPESLVLSAALEPGFYQVTASRNYYLFKTSETWQTVVSSALIRSAETAKLAIGAPSKQSLQILEGQALQQRLAEGVRKLGLATVQQGWQKSASDQPFPWRQTLVLSGATLVCYGLLSTGYLQFQRWSMERDLQAINSEVSTLIQRQDELQRARERIETLQRHQTNWQAVNQFWQTYRLIEQNNVELSFLRGDYTQFMLSGIAGEALPFLQQLNQAPMVASADFDAPVRANGNRQRFIIEYTAAAPPRERGTNNE
ncbi:hypothetical protein [Pseudidiomarina sp. CB1]|uniref:hypothetical protein n=1 Tax=Pseudidiomarina sp. CB1 TaxID=2972484 RepID=UPI0021621B93|nr:hypothetical protein [Pseudidiomarina sp. CB1]